MIAENPKLVNARDQRGATALDHARIQGIQALMALLEEKES